MASIYCQKNSDKAISQIKKKLQIKHWVLLVNNQLDAHAGLACTRQNSTPTTVTRDTPEQHTNNSNKGHARTAHQQQ